MSTENSIGAPRVWIGLFDNGGSFDWKWLDGTPYGYQNFASGEPSQTSNELCVDAFLSIPGKPVGTWNNRVCENEYTNPTLCSIPADLKS